MQRFKCLRCAKSFSESQPLDGIRTNEKDSEQVLKLLAEGVGIRAASRLTGLDQKTILRILESAGAQCAYLLDARLRNVKAEQVQADEIHSFVRVKQYNLEVDDPQAGDFFTYLAIDRASKLIITYRTSKRTSENTLAFLLDLKGRVAPGFQLSTDSFGQYAQGGVRAVFGESITYATETKYFGRPFEFAPRRVIGRQRKRRIGSPDMSQVTTCHAERTNLSVRLFTRRFTRCTLGFSKRVANLRHAVALFIAHFNFCRVHGSLDGQTPAMAAGLTDRVWTIADLLKP